MKSYRLLGSSSSIEGIQQIIEKFFCGSKVTLKGVNDILWDIETGRGLQVGLRVIKTKKRYRFELISELV